MLNNKDFAKLLSQNPDNNGKVRYDLNQIKQWDKQNEAQSKKKSSFGGPFSSTSSKDKSSEEKGKNKGQAEETESDKYKYIDRAEERRKQQGISSLEPQLEAIAATLDYEQSKFLGGDEAHTHLVKGLDYALLRKNREKAPLVVTSSASSSGPISSSSNEPKRALVKPTTLLGQSIHHVLFGAASSSTPSLSSSSMEAGKVLTLSSYAPSSSTSSSSTALMNRSSSTVGLSTSNKKSGVVIGQQGYEFDTDPANANDLPTVIKRSKLVCVFLYLAFIIIVIIVP